MAAEGDCTQHWAALYGGRRAKWRHQPTHSTGEGKDSGTLDGNKNVHRHTDIHTHAQRAHAEGGSENGQFVLKCRGPSFSATPQQRLLQSSWRRTKPLRWKHRQCADACVQRCALRSARIFGQETHEEELGEDGEHFRCCRSVHSKIEKDRGVYFGNKKLRENNLDIFSWLWNQKLIHSSIF